MVQGWAWVSVVPEADKLRFETAARAAGLRGFEIWQRDARGNRAPASKGDVYYPVFQVAPLPANEGAIGYDVGSEPLRHAALETAMRSGLPTATDAITLVQDTGTQKGMLVCRPVFGAGNPRRLCGFAQAVLRMGALLRHACPDASLFMDLSQARRDAGPEMLATTADSDLPATGPLALTRPVFAFGKVFLVTAHAGPEFMRLYPVRAGWLAALPGFGLTAALAIVISVLTQLTRANKAMQVEIGERRKAEEGRTNAQKERDAVEVQLRHAQKLEAIGQLAAGIAHEINTPTQYVGDNTRFVQQSFQTIRDTCSLYAEMLRAAKTNSVTPELVARIEKTAQAGDLDYLFMEIPEAMKQSLEGIERITKIVRAMKEFSHPGSTEKTAANLNMAIESTVTVARNKWKYVADIKLDLDPEMPPVVCFLGDFNQAILNLIVNAAQAIGDVVKQKPGAKGMITVSTRPDGDEVEVRVGDTGTGIPEEVRPRVFEPFFTTKAVVKGTGQGLSVVYGTVVKRHGGTIRFESEMGKGTTFVMRLPVRQRSGAQEPVRPLLIT